MQFSEIPEAVMMRAMKRYYGGYCFFGFITVRPRAVM